MNRAINPYRVEIRPAYIIGQLVAAIIGGGLVFALLLFILVLGFNVFYTSRIYPGIFVGNINLSGAKPFDAALLLSQQITYPNNGRILLRDGNITWQATPSQLGFTLDPVASVMGAFNQGRTGGLTERFSAQFQAWADGIHLPASYVFNEQVAFDYLKNIAAQIELPVQEASLRVNGVSVEVIPGQVGRNLDILATLNLLRIQFNTFSDGDINLPIITTPPAILDVESQAQIARQILSAPLTLVVPDQLEGDPGPWTFEPEVLARMLTIAQVNTPQGEQYQIELQADALRSFLEGITPPLTRTRQNARFIFNDETRKLELIQPATIGRFLDIDATISSINDKLLAGEHKISLDMEYTLPEVGDEATAKQLGISELVSVQTSYFGGSSASRIQNISLASARFHGVLVPPGAVFSMADVLGDVSLDNGYAEALIIYGNRTIKGVGGGVCQVSTTLFRTVFFGGYPVVERYPHAYRVYYYEKTASGIDTDLAGLDATVFVPLVDFKFTNDSPYWLLMETYVNPSAGTLTWKFYSTSDGREVEMHTSGLTDIVKPPKPLYEENPELKKGEIKQMDWEVEGATITVTRIVRRGGEVLYKDVFTTRYLPWRAVYQYGPGTKNMPPDEDDEKDE